MHPSHVLCLMDACHLHCWQQRLEETDSRQGLSHAARLQVPCTMLRRFLMKEWGLKPPVVACGMVSCMFCSDLSFSTDPSKLATTPASVTERASAQPERGPVSWRMSTRPVNVCRWHRFIPGHKLLRRACGPTSPELPTWHAALHLKIFTPQQPASQALVWPSVVTVVVPAVVMAAASGTQLEPHWHFKSTTVSAWPGPAARPGLDRLGSAPALLGPARPGPARLGTDAQRR